MRQGSETVGAYVHFPWCERRCPYCDFATRAEEPQNIPQTRYTNAVVREVKLRRAAGQLGRPLHSVFFGGGTPSLWAPAELARVVSALGGGQDIERTIECNPHSLDDSAIDALLNAGINRMSIGVQSLQDEQLKFLGRLHDRSRALDAVRSAVKRCGRVSADLIFGMPGHRWEDLRDDASQLIDLGVEHLSTYALTIEPGTQFGLRHKKGLLRVSRDELYADLYERLREHLADQGFVHYEVSNFSRPGAESVHNMGYWQGKAYLGLGAAAVGAFDQNETRSRSKNAVTPENYLSRIESDGTLKELADEHETLDSLTQCREAIMLGLRTRTGVDMDSVETTTGVEIAREFKDIVSKLQAEGRLELEGSTMRVPPSHWFRLDSIVLHFF